MRFSITIPAYKAKYLKDTIDSVLAQTYKNFELIIVNDASPEDLDTIVEKYNDSHIHYYKNEKNCGALRVVDNWNICLNKAQGDFVICMGDDDRLLPNCLETYNELIERYPNLDVYHGWTRIIDEYGIPYNMQEPRPERESVYSMIWNRWKGGRLQFIGDFLFRTSILKKNGGFYFFPLAWASDDVSAYIAAGEKGIANTQQPVFEYRVNSQTITSIGNVDEKMNAVLFEKKWYKSFLSKAPTDEIDTIYYKSITKELEHHFRLKIQGLVCSDITHNGFYKWFYWYKRHFTTGLSFSNMVWIFILAIKGRNR